MRKFFTTLLLLVMFAPFAIADEIIIGTGTGEDASIPFNTSYSYSWNETIYPGSEIGGAATINSVAFNCNQAGTLTLSEVDIYMGITERETMSSLLDWTPEGDLTLVYSGENVTIGDSAWETFTLDVPFYYHGTGNLVVVVAKKLSGYNPDLKWYYTSADNTVMYCRNDSSENIADQHPGANQAHGRLSYRANMKLDVTYGSLASPVVITPNNLNLGNRPSGAWMRHTPVTISATDESTTITSITSTNPFFIFSQVELPYELTTENPLELRVSHLSGDGIENGYILVGHSFGTDTLTLTANAYTAEVGDVWEMPYVVSQLPYSGTPAFNTLYNNYLLPGEEQDGADAVYRLTFQEETTMSAMVSGANAKVALYSSNFYGKGGPDNDNYYGSGYTPDDDDDDPFPEVMGETFFYDFNDASIEDWRVIDEDGDFFNWKVSDGYGIQGVDASGCIYSESFDMNSNSPLLPNNFIVTKGLYTITENSTLSFDALPLDPYYYSEYYGVVVSADGENFITVWEHECTWEESSDWTHQTIDLSAYAGRNMYVGLRHFNCTNEYAIVIDNLELSNGTRSAKSNKIENLTVPAGVYYLVASATEQFSVSITTNSEDGLNSVAEVVAEEVNANTAKAYWSWNFIDTKEASTFTLYRRNNFTGEEAVVLAQNLTDTVYVDNTWGNAANGVYQYGVAVVYPAADYTTPVLWSNTLDKNMTASVTVNVEAENGASVAGTTVSFVGIDNSNVYEAVLDATGTYTWNDFRLGNYKYTVALEGYQSCATNEIVTISDDAVFDCTLEEYFNVGDLFVSSTGWAMWNHTDAETYDVKLDGTTVAEVWTNYYQFDVTNLVEGQSYKAEVGEYEYTWTYTPCDNFVEPTNFEAVVNKTNVELSWTLPLGAHPTEFMFDFEDGTLDGFTTIDANNDGRTWGNSTQFSSTDCGYESANSAVSRSYDGMYDFEPNDYLVTESKYEITANSKLTFYVCAENSLYAAEHYGVAISETGNASESDFTMIWEETLSAKEGAKVERGDRAQGNWYQKTIDLSDYAGKNVYIALRHFNCYGQFWINIDNLALTTSAKDDPNTTDLRVAGAMIFRDGERIAGPINEESYVDKNAPYGEHEYSIRVVYGDQDKDIYYSMSCPLAETVEVVRVCDAPRNLHGEEGVNENGEYGVSLIWPYSTISSEWLYYDNGVNVTGIGLGSPSSIHYGIMFPGASLEDYIGTMMTKVSVFDYEAQEGNLMIYYGGDNAPEMLVHSQPYATSGSSAFVELDLTAPLPIDPSMNLWIVFNSLTASYPAPGCETTGDPNGRWISMDGTTWQDVATAGANLNYTWMIRAYVTSELKGEEAMSMADDETKDSTFEHYNIYRGTSNDNYELIGESTQGSYFDQVEAGTYYYQVTAVYTVDGEECESAPANAAGEEVDYVVVTVTSIDENGANALVVYPNPAKDLVKLSSINGQLTAVKIYNTVGMLIDEIELNSTDVEINISDYAPGIYFFNIDGEVVKVIKN
ncbi:MAG: choice-of-anchor J domain-containing protein [Bacteroidales bacterium]|nr:choice-of-anchor J domain-containing protein [Bacteroidales bacterium]